MVYLHYQKLKVFCNKHVFTERILLRFRNNILFGNFGMIVAVVVPATLTANGRKAG